MSDADVLDFVRENEGNLAGIGIKIVDIIDTAEAEIQRLLNSLVEVEKAGNKTGIGYKMIRDHLKSLSVEQLRNMGLTDEYIKSLGKTVDETKNVVDATKDLETVSRSLFEDIIGENPFQILSDDAKKTFEDFQSPIDRFIDITHLVYKLTDAQKLANAGWQMFGDVLTSSLDSAL
mgnify:FL=1